MNLYIVATPIGNLGDCSPRAKELLSQATLIVAEDTRTSGKLLKLLGVLGKKEFVSSHAQSTAKSLEKAILRCVDHEIIVLVTDAGTPAISDPGALFVKTFRAQYPEAKVIPIPGPSAAIAALSVSGFPSSHFEFLGFLPHKKGRQTLLQYIAKSDHTIVFYESPHRLLKTLEALAIFDPGRHVLLAREITKQFEEYPCDSVQALFDHYSLHPEKNRGECTLVVAPRG